jgi:hypothetical protein
LSRPSRGLRLKGVRPAHCIANRGVLPDWRSGEGHIGKISVGDSDIYGRWPIPLHKRSLFIVLSTITLRSQLPIARVLYQDRVTVRGNPMKAEGSVALQRSREREAWLPSRVETDHAVIQPVPIQRRYNPSANPPMR